MNCSLLTVEYLFEVLLYSTTYRARTYRGEGRSCIVSVQVIFPAPNVQERARGKRVRGVKLDLPDLIALEEEKSFNKLERMGYQIDRQLI